MSYLSNQIACTESAEQLEVGVDAKLLEQGDFINAKPTR